MAKYGYLEVKEESNGRFIKLKQTGNYLNLLDMFDRQAFNRYEKQNLVH